MKTETITTQSANTENQFCWLPIDYWYSEFHFQERQPQPSTWVRLLELINPYCDDEALLLCQHSESEWIAWLPGYGEIILNNSQFC